MSGKIREADKDTGIGATVTQLPARSAANVAAATHGIARNPGMKLDLGFLESMRAVNRSALERRVGSLTKRRSIKDAVEGSQSGRVLQTAFKAAQVLREFLHEGEWVTRHVPGSFYEFIQRERLQ